MRLIAAVVFLICAVGLGAALGQEGKDCKPVRERGSALLSQCGDVLKSWELKHSDERWRVASDIHNRQSFHCVLLGSRTPAGKTVYDALRAQGGRSEAPCPNEPALAFSFIAPSEWIKSARDGKAILDVFRRTPHFVVAEMHSGGLPEMQTSCPVFRVTIKGFEGQATCLVSDGPQGHAIVGVWVDNDIGFVLVLGEDGKNIEMTRARFESFLSGLTVVRASGDSALLRWF